jgi:hypothetical protein
MIEAVYGSHSKDTLDAATTSVCEPKPPKKGGKAAPPPSGDGDGES